MKFLDLFFRRGGQKGITIDSSAPPLVAGMPAEMQKLFGDKSLNSAVTAGQRWIRRTAPEAPLTLCREDVKGQAEHVSLRSKDLPTQAIDLLRLIKRPNPQTSGRLLMSMVAMSAAIDGNGYIEIVEDALLRPAELWYVPPHLCEPVADADGYLLYYRVTRKTSANRGSVVLPRNMIHVKDGIDPNNQLKGCSDLKAVAREILGDNKAAEYIACLLTNPLTGLAVIPKGGSIIPQAEAKALIERLKSRVGGNARFGTVAMTQEVTFQEFGITPDKMPIEKTRAGAVERILAVIGLDPMVVGLPSQNKTYSNYEEARRAAYESLIIPMQWLVCDELDNSLLVRYPQLIDAFWFAFDLRQVRVLQPDENARWDRLGQAYTNGGITRAEYRTQLGGFEAVAGRDDVFATEVSAMQGQAPMKQALKQRLRDRRRVFDALRMDDVDDEG